MKNSLLFVPPAWTLTTLLVLFFIFSLVANVRGSPKLGLGKAPMNKYKNFLNEGDFKAHYYEQALDHFSSSPASYTFRQKYMMNSKYWGGGNENAPIFALLGETRLGEAFQYIEFMSENAERYKALLVHIEHRCEGESVPFKSRQEAFRNSTLGYLSPAQVEADYANILIDIKEKLGARGSPVVALGRSHGYELTTWFGEKYPQVVNNALASSAPILYS